MVGENGDGQEMEELQEQGVTATGRTPEILPTAGSETALALAMFMPRDGGMLKVKTRLGE